MTLDKIDKHILYELQNNARISNLDLAESVHLSPTPCARRVKQLEEAGIIIGHHAKLDHERLGGLCRTFDSVCMVSVLRELQTRYGVLAHFSTTDPDVLHVTPPLTVTAGELDVFLAAVDDLLQRGLARAVTSFVAGNLRHLLR